MDKILVGQVAHPGSHLAAVAQQGVAIDDIIERLCFCMVQMSPEISFSEQFQYYPHLQQKEESNQNTLCEVLSQSIIVSIVQHFILRVFLHYAINSKLLPENTHQIVPVISSLEVLLAACQSPSHAW